VPKIGRPDIHQSDSEHVFLAGQIYSFRTSPITEFSEPQTGRYAALKVLAVDDLVTFVVLDGVFAAPPVLSAASGLPMLRNERFFFTGKIALNWVPVGWSIDLLEFRYLGVEGVSKEELAVLTPLRGYSSWSTASADAEGEWRWRHDRERLRNEVEQANKARDAKRLAEQQRDKVRLKGLTWAKLRDEEHFSRWRESPPFPPPEFRNAARAAIQRTISELEALGSKPRKQDVRIVLRTSVEWFNSEDERYDNVIETEEREDICLILRDLAVVAGHRSLAVEIDDWRTW